jgi:membrane fusion protein (multidrug efflux system)
MVFMKVAPIPVIIVSLVSLSLPACHPHDEHAHHEAHHKIVVTSPKVKDVVITQHYVCQIRSRRHIEVCPLTEGYLEKIELKEGQAVKEGDELFKILPTLYKARLEAEQAKANVARIKYEQSQILVAKQTVSPIDAKLAEAEFNEADARARQAKAEVNFTVITAKFDGIVDRLYKQEGSFVDKKDVLTTLSDNAVMWVYFNVPELQFLEYRAREGKDHNLTQLKLVDAQIELILANGSKFNQPGGNTLTIEGDVNFETGNFKLRADFPNPDRALRNGQTGTVRVLRAERNAVVIPQRATFEILDKQYVWVVGEDKVVHQRHITIAHELEDKFVISSGLDAKDRFILEGVRQVHEGDKLEEFEFEKPDAALAHQKYHAE